MTNIDRAADILAEAGAYCGLCCFGECGEPDCPRDADWRACPDCAAAVNGYARALAAAGLLAPDLPPVTVDDLDRLSVAVGPASPGDVRDTRMGRILLEEDGLIFTTGVPNPYRSIDQARAHALAILAMCDHAEGGAS